MYILQTSLSLSPYHEGKSRRKTWHNSKEEILEAQREREKRRDRKRCINQTDRGDLWRGMDKVVGVLATRSLVGKTDGARCQVLYQIARHRH